MMIDLNADLGEGFGPYRIGDDAAVLASVSSVNIATGFHAGDPEIMRQTVARAKESGVAIGAHPGYPDRRGFGRREWRAPDPEAIYADVLYQLGALAAFCRAAGAAMAHVKPHGALYNQAMRDTLVAEPVAAAIAAFDPDLIVVAQPDSALSTAATARGLHVAREGYADRAYRADGRLVPRSEPGAVLHDGERVVARAVEMVRDGVTQSIDGTPVRLHIDTLSLHGDTPGAADLAGAIRAALDGAGVAVRPLRAVLGRSG